MAIIMLLPIMNDGILMMVFMTLMNKAAIDYHMNVIK